MKKLILLTVYLMTLKIAAQDLQSYAKPPVFSECDSEDITQIKDCFYSQLSDFINTNFKIPEVVENENYAGEVVVLFEVNAEGEFVALYIDAIYEELKSEVKRIFGELPKIKPATYNGNPTFSQYSYRIKIPLTSESIIPSEIEQESNEISELELKSKQEFDSISKSIKPYEDLEYS